MGARLTAHQKKIIHHERVLKDLFDLFFSTEEGYDPDKELDSDVLGEGANLLWPLAKDFAGEDAKKFRQTGLPYSRSR